jgi:hypothetical protein
MAAFKFTLTTLVDGVTPLTPLPIIRRVEITQKSDEQRTVALDGLLVDLMPTSIGVSSRRALLLSTDQQLEVYADTTGLYAPDTINAADPILLMTLEAGGVLLFHDLASLDKLLFKNTGTDEAHVTIFVAGN